MVVVLVVVLLSRLSEMYASSVAHPSWDQFVQATFLLPQRVSENPLFSPIDGVFGLQVLFWLRAESNSYRWICRQMLSL